MLTRQQLIEFLGAGRRRVHFVGIGGAGMSGLARLLALQGHRVSGSDASPNGNCQELEKLGVKVQHGHAARHVRSDVELVVYTTAVDSTNEEMQAAAALQVPVVKRGALLSALMNHRANIAVAGTHGKTTTTSMIAHVLTRSDSAPSFCVGAEVPVLGSNAQLGGGKYFVAEACESDGTLIGFTPDYAVCLNVEAEHLDHHKTMENLLETFARFFTSTLQAVFYCVDCENCVALAGKARQAISFGFSEKADYRATEIEPTSRGSRFVVSCRGDKIGAVELVIPGKQNVMNALAAIAVADQLGVAFEKVAEALKEFTGAKRRFERHYESDVVVVDDYGHHPTEIRATLAAARTLGFKRILVAFQPHRYSRTQALREEFGKAFVDADKLFLTDIYAASEKPIPGIDGQTIPKAVVANGQGDLVYEADFGALAKRLVELAQPGDLIMTMGAGDIYKVARQVAKELSRRKPVRAKNPANLAADLKRLLSAHSQVRASEPMFNHTSFKVGGPAQCWVEPSDETDLARLLKYCAKHRAPVTMVGRGSNLLVLDGGIPGVVLHLGSPEFSRIMVNGERLTARCGARLRTIVAEARRHELGGLEFMEGIPGSLGGALRMNAGAMGKQTFEVVEWVRYMSMSGDVYDAEASTLPVTYRNCPTFATHIALEAILRGQPTPGEVIDSTIKTFTEKRWSTQPNKPSAGCVFRNPPVIPVGKLIDELGLKGTKVGGACISNLHGNFIVNEGNATARDVLALIELVRERAREERGIELETEVMIVGSEK